MGVFFPSPQSRRPRIWTQRRRHQALAPRKLQKHRQNRPCHLARGRQRTERRPQREKQKKRRQYVSSTAPCARWPSTPPPSCRLTTAVRRRGKPPPPAALIAPSYAAFKPPVHLNCFRHQTQDDAGGAERRRSHQVLSEGGGQVKAGRAAGVVDGPPEQNVSLRDLRCARQLRDAAQTGRWL